MASSSIRSSSSILLDPLPDFSFLPVSIGCRGWQTSVFVDFVVMSCCEVILMASRIHSSFQAILSKHLQNETSQLQLTDSQTSRSNASDYSLSAAACIVEQLDFSNLSSWLQSASDGALSAHQTKSLKLEPMRADSNFTSSATETEGELEKLKLRDDTESKHVPLKKKTGHTKLPISGIFKKTV